MIGGFKTSILFNLYKIQKVTFMCPIISNLFTLEPMEFPYICNFFTFRENIFTLYNTYIHLFTNLQLHMFVNMIMTKKLVCEWNWELMPWRFTVCHSSDETSRGSHAAASLQKTLAHCRSAMTGWLSDLSRHRYTCKKGWRLFICQQKQNTVNITYTVLLFVTHSLYMNYNPLQ